MNNIIEAPKINVYELWNMKYDAFNSWRKKNDYPRIVKFFKEKLPLFEKWMLQQDLIDKDLIEHTPSIFIKDEKKLLLYNTINNNEIEEEICHYTNYSIGQSLIHNNELKRIIKKKSIIPYPTWFTRQKTTLKLPTIAINSRRGRQAFFMNELELLDMGNTILPNNYLLVRRNLDFLNLDDLQLIKPINNSYIKLWYSTVNNLVVEGDLAFIDSYSSQFSGVWNSIGGLKLFNGTFQNWSFVNCTVRVFVTNSILNRWNVAESNFNATLNLSDIKESKFTNKATKYLIQIAQAQQFHAHVKRIYSQLGRKAEAGEHYYQEKKYERKSFLHIRANYREEYFDKKKKGFQHLLFLYFKYWFKYAISSFLNILWGYGEKPFRVFGITIFLIIAFTFLYYLNGFSKTSYNFFDSLYYSLVTFTTLGYGDISQTTTLLKILSGFEALLGMSFLGILIAGFSSKAKDY